MLPVGEQLGTGNASRRSSGVDADVAQHCTTVRCSAGDRRDWGPKIRHPYRPCWTPISWHFRQSGLRHRDRPRALRHAAGVLPLKLLPYTPASHFDGQTNDPGFKTKPQLAIDLIEAVRQDWPYRAVVADSFCGGNKVFRQHLIRNFIPFVLTLPSSYTWWHHEDQPGGVEERALRAAPEAWHPFLRTSADGHQERQWVAELQGGPFGPQR
ncbi:hypothetical protein ACVWZX_004567 [Deinococcus sp. UYEF24]